MSAHPAVPFQAGDLRFNLLLPVTRVGVGVFSFGPLERLIGCSVESILSSMMTGPKTVRQVPGTSGVEVYPLRLPVGEGAFIPLKQLGELGLKNEHGLLRITVPAQAGEVDRGAAGECAGQRAAAGLERGPAWAGSACLGEAEAGDAGRVSGGRGWRSGG